MTLAELKQLVAQQTAEAKAKAKTDSEEFRLKAQLQALESGALHEAMMTQAAIESDVDTLKQLIAQCEAVVELQPIYDATRKQNKRWNGRPLYGHGLVVNNLYQLLTGVMYSTPEHKQVMLAQLGLSESLIENLVNAFGSPSYYSIREERVVDELPFNSDILTKLLPLVSVTLGIQVPMHELVEAKLQARFERQSELAQQAEAQAQLTKLSVGDVNFTM
jgi:hypothetical protein